MKEREWFCEPLSKLGRFLNDFSAVDELVAFALGSVYDGAAHAVLEECNSIPATATYRVDATQHRDPAWDAPVIIEWWTGSDHYVRFEVDADGQLEKLQIGNDESSIFYPLLLEALGFGEEDVATVTVPFRPTVEAVG